jgi:hypothetical protein
LNLKVKSSGDDWDEHLNHALFDIRIRPHTATKFSPFEMFHTWEMRIDPHETEIAEEEALLQAMDTEDKAVEEQLGKSCEEMITRFNAAREIIREKATENIEKEQYRQKKGFDTKNLGKGTTVNQGMNCSRTLTC